MRAIATYIVLALTATQAMAAGTTTEAEGNGTMTIICAAFVALIVLFQFAPGMTLLFGALKGVFGGKEAVRPEHAGK